MIFCAFKEQLEVFLTLKSVEIEMSFKRIRDRHINEIVFTTWLSDDNKSMFISYLLIHYLYHTNQRLVFALLRIIVNTETAWMYEQLFIKVFSLVREITGVQLQFHHIHGKGLNAVVMDMNFKQMAGMFTTSGVSVENQ